MSSPDPERELYELREVPDPDGSLADALADLIDNSALVRLAGSSPDYEAAAKSDFERYIAKDWESLDPERRATLIEEAKHTVDAAFPGLFEERP